MCSWKYVVENYALPSWVVFATIAGGENRKPGGLYKNLGRRYFLVRDLKVLRATEESAEHSLFVLGDDAVV